MGAAGFAGEAPPPLADGPVRNVVLIVGDGMGLAQVAAARLRVLGPEGRFVFERYPVVGLVDTRPAGGLITKSDAGATALATGVKTVNGRVGEDPEGRALPTLIERSRDAGLATGMVTTSSIVDATPASFSAHAGRYEYERIAGQIAAAGIDLLAGGGRERVAPDGLDRGPLAAAAARGVAVVTDLEGFTAASRLPLWAVFPGTTLGESPAHPDVAELAAKALELLGAEARRRNTGFFLLVEEEGADTGGHERDLERTSAGVARLDRAVAVATRFAAADGGTLVLVTADHGTGGLSIDSTSTRERLRVVWASGHHSGEPVPLYAYGPAAAAQRFGGVYDNTEIHDRIAEALALPTPATSTEAVP
ncbi:MAG: alkaline phosphatase [Thermoanaerobaculia bacterium]|nr:MAG: alkaline phosphatase [Thermoanaerobaculia bacterium]